MSNEQARGNFEQIKGKIKQKWGNLTDNEVDSIKGDWQVLKGMVQERYGMAKEKAEQEVNGFLENLKEGNHALKENINEASEAFVGYVKKKPMTSVAIALAAGFLLSLLLRI